MPGGAGRCGGEIKRGIFGVKFSEEMKMMLQIQQLSLQNQRVENLRAVQEDYQNLVQKLLNDLEMQIRSDIAGGKFTASIEGDSALPLSPVLQCSKIPQLEESPKLFYYETTNNTIVFRMAPLCRGIYDGKRMASKNVCIELTEAGRKLLGDFSEAAQQDGIALTFQPALMTKNGQVILPQFGVFEYVPNAKHGKKGVLNDFYVNIHYVIL